MIDLRLPLGILTFLAVGLLLLLNLKGALRGIRRIRPRILIALSMVFTLSLLVHLSTPAGHIVTFDEWEYMSTAESILVRGEYSYCTLREGGSCSSYTAPFHNPGYPMLVAMARIFVGDIDRSAFFVSSLMGLASIACVFTLCLLLIKDDNAAFFCACIYASFPLNALYSNSGASEVTSVFFVLLAAISLLSYLKHGTTQVLYLGVASFTFACQVKAENIVFAIPLLFMFISGGKERKKKVIPPTLFSIAVLVIVYLNVFWVYGSIDESEKHFFSFTLENIKGYTLYLVGFQAHTMVVGLLGVFGFRVLYGRDKRASLFLSTWTISYLILFATYGVRFDQAFSSRRLLVLYPVLAICCGLALSWIKNFIALKSRRQCLASIGALTVLSGILLLNASFLQFNERPSFKQVIVKNWAEKDFEKLAGGIGSECYVVTMMDTSGFIIREFNGSVIEGRDMILDRKTLLRRIDEGKCVYYYTLSKNIREYWIGEKLKEDEAKLREEFDFTTERSGIGELYLLAKRNNSLH